MTFGPGKEHRKEVMEIHLKERPGELFGLEYDIPLYM
jgi:hypothetical protein